MDVSFPTDRSLFPFLLPEEAANTVAGQSPSRITTDLEVGVPEVSTRKEVRAARADFENGKAKQRVGV